MWQEKKRSHVHNFICRVAAVLPSIMTALLKGIVLTWNNKRSKRFMTLCLLGANRSRNTIKLRHFPVTRTQPKNCVTLPVASSFPPMPNLSTLLCLSLSISFVLISRINDCFGDLNASFREMSLPCHCYKLPPTVCITWGGSLHFLIRVLIYLFIFVRRMMMLSSLPVFSGGNFYATMPW